MDPVSGPTCIADLGPLRDPVAEGQSGPLDLIFQGAGTEVYIVI